MPSRLLREAKSSILDIDTLDARHGDGVELTLSAEFLNTKDSNDVLQYGLGRSRSIEVFALKHSHFRRRTERSASGHFLSTVQNSCQLGT